MTRYSESPSAFIDVDALFQLALRGEPVELTFDRRAACTQCVLLRHGKNEFGRYVGRKEIGDITTVRLKIKQNQLVSVAIRLDR